jgi:hypothetical protein
MRALADQRWDKAMEYEDEEDNDPVGSICDGIRRGLSRVGLEPLPDRFRDLLENLRTRERNSNGTPGGNGQVSASQ